MNNFLLTNTSKMYTTQTEVDSVSVNSNSEGVVYPSENIFFGFLGLVILFGIFTVVFNDYLHKSFKKIWIF